MEIMELALQFDNSSMAKDDLRKAYEKWNDIPQENCALIDTFLKQKSDKDYEMHLAIKFIVENIFALASTEADYSHADSPYYLNVGLIMAFDPTKSLNYKVVHAGQTSSHIDIRTYCSETGN
ncbi:hypothetical protein Tco_0740826 [Tanacetum coccineum]